MKGNRLKKNAVDRASARVYQLELASHIQSNSLVLVKASNGVESKSIPYLPTSKPSMRANASLDFCATETMGALAKLSAVIDILQVTATGFATKKIEMTSYDTTVNVTLDAEGDRWGGLKNPAAKSADCGKALGTLKTGKYKIMSGHTNRDYTIDWLKTAGLIFKLPIVNKAWMPLSAYAEESVFKLYLFDIGLLGAMGWLSPRVLLDFSLGSFKG